MGRVNHGVRARVGEGVARLGAANLDLATLIEESNALLAKALPYDAGCWHTADPHSLIETSVRLEHMPTARNVPEFAYLPDDYNAFPTLARGERHSGVLSEATGGDLNRSTRYRELLANYGMGGELRISLVADGAGWGCCAFFRATPKDFTEDERDFAHQTASVLGRAFRTAGTRARTVGAAATLWPGVVLLGEDRRVESITAAARRWFAELGTPFPGDATGLPVVVRTIAERVLGTGTATSARVLGASGDWIQVVGSPTEGGAPGRVAIVLQSATPPSLAPLISATYGLTPRERELTELVLHGYPTAEIATKLFISPHTVQEHLKSIFTKTGVRSRRELVTRVFVR
jgi:DNA-binding CsgD family transcriptional regulator